MGGEWPKSKEAHFHRQVMPAATSEKDLRQASGSPLETQTETAVQCVEAEPILHGTSEAEPVAGGTSDSSVGHVEESDSNIDNEDLELSEEQIMTLAEIITNHSMISVHALTVRGTFYVALRRKQHYSN